jgi:hypothetical protein
MDLANAYLMERRTFVALYAAFLSHDSETIRLAMAAWQRAKRALSCAY